MKTTSAGAAPEGDGHLLPGLLEGLAGRRRASRWLPEALPKRPPANGARASATSGRTGEVAAWSR